MTRLLIALPLHWVGPSTEITSVTVRGLNFLDLPSVACMIDVAIVPATFRSSELVARKTPLWAFECQPTNHSRRFSPRRQVFRLVQWRPSVNLLQFHRIFRRYPRARTLSFVLYEVRPHFGPTLGLNTVILLCRNFDRANWDDRPSYCCRVTAFAGF